MKKIYIKTMFLFILISGIAFLIKLTDFSSFFNKYYYIAAIAPISGPLKEDGRAMLQGINLCVEEINNKGGVNGRKIKIQLYDDRNQTQVASNIASQIIEDKDILLVLGNFDSSTAITAGNIYRKNGLPAITASATAMEVTSSNNFYFRIVPNNNFQGGFIANYLKAIGESSISVIYDYGSYGTSLLESFEKSAKDIGIKINRKWGFDIDSDTLNENVSKILSELRAQKDPGIIFLAVQSIFAPQIITKLKYLGTNYKIICPDTFTMPSFLNAFKQYTEDKNKTGTYLDGIYALTPFVKELSTDEAVNFSDLYKKKYSEEPSWISALYYDAVLVAAEAIKISGIEEYDHIRKARNQIRDALASMNRSEDALKGVTGQIYFDKNREVNRPFTVGVYKNQSLMPLYLQYQLINEQFESEDTLLKVVKGDIIIIDGKIMQKYKLVYAGIDVQEITNFNLRTGTYDMDFYLWFKFANEFDDKNIKFINSVKPVQLDIPMFQKQEGETITRSYHVKDTFKGDFSLTEYPFNKHYLDIKFYHANLTRDKLVYIVDNIGLGSKILAKDKKNIDNIKFKIDHSVTFKTELNWSIMEYLCYQNTRSTSSTFGISDFLNKQKKISYSQFNLSLLIEKLGKGAILKNFFPVVALILFLYLINYLPLNNWWVHIFISGNVLLITALLHLRLVKALSVPYATKMEYVYFIVYAMVILTNILLSCLFVMKKNNDENKIRIIQLIGKIVFLPCALGTIIWLFY